MLLEFRTDIHSSNYDDSGTNAYTRADAHTRADADGYHSGTGPDTDGYYSCTDSNGHHSGTGSDHHSCS